MSSSRYYSHYNQSCMKENKGSTANGNYDPAINEMKN